MTQWIQHRYSQVFPFIKSHTCKSIILVHDTAMNIATIHHIMLKIDEEWRYKYSIKTIHARTELPTFIFYSLALVRKRERKTIVSQVWNYISPCLVQEVPQRKQLINSRVHEVYLGVLSQLCALKLSPSRLIFFW